MSDLYTKVNQSIKLLKTVAKTVDGPIELSYSGGKDSDVILRLAQMAGINYRAIYKNTTIDPPGTIKHCLQNEVEIINPKQTFFQLVEKNGTPSRFQRFCCKILKEYKVLDTAIHGIRRSESGKRAANYKEPIVCRLYNKKEHVNVLLPILEWSDRDVKEFIVSEKINLHPIYYTSDGDIDVKKRLGCIGCPLASLTKVRENFKEYPKLLRLYIKAYTVYFNHAKEKKLRTAQLFDDPYDVFVFKLFYNSLSGYKASRLFPETKSCKQLLEDYFKIDL